MKRRGPKALPRQYRVTEGAIRRIAAAEGAGDEQPTYEISFSSEAPVQRWFGKEVLSHARGAVDMRYLQKGGCVLFDHWGEPIGVMDEAWVDDADRVIRAKVRFSRSARAQQIRQDVDDDIITRASIGYQIVRWRLDKEGETEADNEFTATRWMPYEGSLVGIPADLSVGVGRSKPADEAQFPIEFEGGDPAEEVRSMKCNICGLLSCAHTPEQRAAHTAANIETRGAGGGNPAAAADAGARGTTAVVDPPGDGARGTGAAPAGPTVTDANELRRDIEQIARLGERHGMMDRVSGWISRGLTSQQVGAEILDARATRPVSQPGAESPNPGRRDAQRFSYRKLIAELADGEVTGLEREWSQEIANALPKGHRTNGGVFAPTRVIPLTEEQREQRMLRTMGATVPGGGAELVPTERGEFIDLLQNSTVLIALGATLLDDLAGDYETVRENAAPAATWVGELPAADVGDTQGAYEVIGGVPKQLMANTPFTRRLLRQTSGAIEQRIRTRLATAHALGIDIAGLYGSGSKYMPQGLWNTPGVLTFAMGGQPDWVKVNAMPGQIASKNALLGALGWATHPTLASLLKAKPQATQGGTPGWIWTGSITNGEVAGYRSIASNQVSNTMTGLAQTGGTDVGLAFGNWADLEILNWGALEFLIDETTQKKKGIIEVTSYELCDIVIRHPESFIVATGATL